MCGTASVWAKLALGCIVLGMTLHIAGWASMYWMVYETSGSVLQTFIGLWRQKTCQNNVCTEDAVDKYVTADFNAVRAMETITFCVAAFTAILMTIYVFAPSARRQSVAIVLMVLCFIAGATSICGMIIWLVTLPSPFIVSFSMGLTVLGFLLILIAGTLLIPDVFEPMDSYNRSGLITPYTPPDRRTVVTPLSYKGGGAINRW